MTVLLVIGLILLYLIGATVVGGLVWRATDEPEIAAACGIFCPVVIAASPVLVIVWVCFFLARKIKDWERPDK